tara:strand:+ start:1951 stop:2391 length:441 start_codon:yes stop_codon:yes gene_type:complete
VFQGMFGQAIGNLFNNKSVDTNATDKIQENNSALVDSGASTAGESFDVDIDLNDPEAVKNLQNKMVADNPDALTKYGVDGKWGDESQGAYNEYMAKQQTPVKQAFSNTMESSYLENEGGGGVSTNPETGYQNPVYAAPEWGLRKKF